MNATKNLSIIVIILLIVSCNPYKKKLHGLWIVNEVRNKQNNESIKVYFNGFYFANDGTCGVPTITPYNGLKQCFWKIIRVRDTNYLELTPQQFTPNTDFFKGKYTFVLYDNAKGLHKLKLISSSLEIVCTKDEIFAQ